MSITQCYFDMKGALEEHAEWFQKNGVAKHSNSRSYSVRYDQHCHCLLPTYLIWKLKENNSQTKTQKVGRANEVNGTLIQAHHIQFYKPVIYIVCFTFINFIIELRSKKCSSFPLHAYLFYSARTVDLFIVKVNILAIIFHRHYQETKSNQMKMAYAAELNTTKYSQYLHASKSSQFLKCSIHIKRLKLITFLAYILYPIELIVS